MSAIFNLKARTDALSSSKASGERERSCTGFISRDAITLPSMPLGEVSDEHVASSPQDAVPGPGCNADKYVLHSELGSGGMGVIYRAHHTRLARDVAIKVIRPEYARHPEAVNRLFREARALAALDSPGIVKIYDCDVTSDGAPFIAMELLRGQDLRAVLDAGRSLETSVALRLVSQAARAIGQAHQAGLVHRDLKPENLFLAQTPTGATQLKVLDFGVVRDASSARITLSDTVLGSVDYMAPEQIRDSHAVDARADVWSLGVILFECLTGTLPFAQTSSLAASASILHDRATDVRELRPEVPRAVAHALRRCLCKDRAQRFPDAQALAEALLDCVPAAQRRHRSTSKTNVTAIAVGVASPDNVGRNGRTATVPRARKRSGSTAKRRFSLASKWAVASALVVGAAAAGATLGRAAPTAAMSFLHLTPPAFELLH